MMREGGRSGWVGPVIAGGVVGALSGALLSVGVGLLWPAIGDEASVHSDIVGIAIWLLAGALGGWEMARRRMRKPW